MSSRTFPITAAIAMLLLSGVMKLAAEGRAEKAAAPPGPAKVTYLEGEVELNGEEAAIGQEVPLGSTVRTGRRAYCEIVFAGRNIFRIQAESVAVVDLEIGRGSISLQQGALAAVFYKLQRLGTNEATIRLNTPTAVAGVRGTAFFIKVESPESTYVCTCNGILSLTDIQESVRRLVRSENHKAFRFIQADGETKVRSAPLLYHNSASMNTLARRIRVSIPWGEEANESY